jgi:protein O-GlcNAc transferase
LLGIIALLYSIRTVTRNREWRSDEVLFRQVLASQGDASLIRSDLGGILFDRGDYTGAEREWLEALSTGPTNSNALDNMAVLRQREHRYAESIDYSWQALRATPVYTIMHIHLAETLTLMGRAGEAESQFRIATALSPLSTRALNGYGKFLFEAGRTGDARTEYEHSAAVDATSEAYDRLGDIYLGWQDSPRAEQAFRRAIGVDPFDGHAHIGLGEVLESAGRPGDALREYEAGLETDPSDPIAKAALIRICGNAPVKTAPHSGILHY